MLASYASRSLILKLCREVESYLTANIINLLRNENYTSKCLIPYRSELQRAIPISYLL